MNDDDRLGAGRGVRPPPGRLLATAGSATCGAPSSCSRTSSIRPGWRSSCATGASSRPIPTTGTSWWPRPPRPSATAAGSANGSATATAAKFERPRRPGRLPPLGFRRSPSRRTPSRSTPTPSARAVASLRALRPRHGQHRSSSPPRPAWRRCASSRSCATPSTTAGCAVTADATRSDARAPGGRTRRSMTSCGRRSSGSDA